MKMVILFVFSSLLPSTLVAQKNREVISFDNDWRFYLGDIPMPIIKGHSTSYSNAKAGKAWGAAAPDFDDTEWRTLQLPHDWAVEQPFDSTENISQNYRKRGIGWYRRNFKIDSTDRGRHIEIQFDGVASHCTVWLNGTIVHRNWSGYTSFYIDATPFIHYGEEVNNIAIHVDAIDQEGWWYEGAGIYRHTWLVKRSPIHIITDGVYANPIKKSNGQWLLPIETNIENTGRATGNTNVEITLLDGKNKIIRKKVIRVAINPLQQVTAKININISNPKLWWVDTPTLYSVKTTLKQNDKVIDAV